MDVDRHEIPPQKQMTGMLGHPVAENPIDRMFDAVYAHYGLPWQFWKNDIATEEDLALAVAALRPLGYRGMAITVPWKVAVIPLLDEVDDDVRAIGAANYMTIERGRLIGHNNDGKGVVKAIRKVASLDGQRVVMLGAGGAGRAMAVELAWAGAAHITLVTRREEQGREVADTVTRASGVPAVWQPWGPEVTVPAGTTLLMNATHLGCAPELEPVPVRWDTVDPTCIVVDVITNPRITPFLAAAGARGCPVVDGVEMLVQLAIQIFQCWTAVVPAEAVFQRAVAEALGETPVAGTSRYSHIPAGEGDRPSEPVAPGVGDRAGSHPGFHDRVAPLATPGRKPMTDAPIRTIESGTVVISPQGRLTMNTGPALREQLRGQVQSGNVDLIVDLSGVDLIDSAGLSALISGLKAARQAGGSLRVAQPSTQVAALLKLTNLHRVLGPYDGVDGP